MADPVENSVVNCEVGDSDNSTSELADVVADERPGTSVDLYIVSSLDDVIHETVSHYGRDCETLLRDGGTSEVILNMFWIVVSSILYVFDVATDFVWVAVHYRNNDYWYFGLTLFFSTTPSLVMAIVSANWYRAERNKDLNDANKLNIRDLFPPESKPIFILKCVCGFFLLGPLPRYCEALYYGVQCIQFYAKAVQFPPFHGAKKKEASTKMGQCFFRMTYENADATFLTLFECFMESAPQLALQLYRLSVKKFDFGENIFYSVILPVVSVVFSFTSLSWTLMIYDRKLCFMKGISERASQQQPILSCVLQGLNNVSIIKIAQKFPMKKCLLLFFANLFWIVSRFIPLISFTSVYGWIICVICLIHSILLALWHWWKKYNITYTSVLSLIHIFVYLHPLDKHHRSIVRSRHPRINAGVYYIVCLIENSILMGIWGYSFNCLEDGCLPWCYAAWIGHYLAFLFSFILFELFYNRKIQLCVMGNICCRILPSS